MSIDRDHFPINPNGNTADGALLPMEADPILMSYPDRTHSTLPIVAADAPEALPDQTVDVDPSTPWYKKRSVQILGGAGLVIATVFVGNTVAAHHEGTETTSESAAPFSEFPKDVAYGPGFSELPINEQVAIRRLHDLSPQEFEALPLEKRFQYNRYVVDANIARIVTLSENRSRITGIPKLVDKGPPLASDTAYEVESRRAIKVALASGLIDTKTGIPDQNYPETFKMASFIYQPGSLGYGIFIDSVREAEQQDLAMENITPCEVLESHKEGNTVTYSCKMLYTEKGGFTHAVRSAVWTPFTTLDGKQSGEWILTRNEGYRTEPHI